MKSVNIIGSSSARIFFKNCKNLNNNNESFSEYYKKNLYNTLNLNGLIISGLSIYGLDNKKSKTKGAEEIEKFLAINKSNNIIFFIGEVDLVFLVFYRMQKYKEKLKDILSTITDKLKIYIEKFTNKNVIFICPLLPSVDDDNFVKLLLKYDSLPVYCGENNNFILENDNILNYADRTNMTISFNNKLKSILKCKIIDINHFLLDSEKMLLKKQFKMNDPIQHHLNDNIYSILFHEINKIIPFIPMPIPETFGTDLYLNFRDAYSDLYHTNYNYSWSSKNGVIHANYYITKNLRILDKSIYNNCKTLLDVGCSDGFWSNLLSQYFIVYGEDNCENAIKQASNKYKNATFFVKNSLNEKTKYDILFCKGPAFFNEPVDDIFVDCLEKIIQRTNKVLIFTMYSKKPFNKRYNRSYYHDPETIKNLLKKYGDIVEYNWFNCYFTIIMKINT